MNFLAHFHLAWPNDGLIAGGLEGDFYKGPLGSDLPRDLALGVQLHRAIDAYTDAHPCVQALRRELPTPLRRYAGILIDLSFDHYLSNHWAQFSRTPQAEFNQRVYGILREREEQLSDKSRNLSARLIQYDILGLYADWETVTATARRVGERFVRHNPFLDIASQLDPCRPTLERAFLEFYPQLETFCVERRQTLRVE